MRGSFLRQWHIQPRKLALLAVLAPLLFSASGATAQTPPTRMPLDGSTQTQAASKDLPVGLEIVEPAQLRVRTFLEDDTSESGLAKTKILVDGKVVGRTNANGNLRVDVAPGQRHIAALRPFEAGAATTANLVPGKNKAVHLILRGSSLNQVEDYNLVLLKSNKGLLPADFASFLLKLVRPDGTAVVVDSLDSISVVGIAPGSATNSVGGDPATTPKDLGSRLELAQGGRVIKASNVVALRKILSNIGGQMQIEVLASNLKKGIVYEDFVTLQLGSFMLDGKLKAPPSKPGLSVQNLPVEITLLNTNKKFKVKSKANGSFSLPTPLPLGSIHISAAKTAGNKAFSGQGTIFMNSDKDATINLLATKDILDGVPELEITSDISMLSINAVIDGQDAADRWAAERAQMDAAQRRGAKAKFPEPSPAAAGTVRVVATGAGQGINVVAAKTLTVPAGVAVVTLTYTVSIPPLTGPGLTGLKQSVLDDVWSLAVKDQQTNESLFAITRSVNSQRRQQEPLWQRDGTTSKIIRVIEVPGALNAERKLRVIAQSKNVVGSSSDTTVDAKLSTERPKLNFTLSHSGLSRFMSIPKRRDRVEGRKEIIYDGTKSPTKVNENFFHRFLRARVESPEDFNVADLTSVKVKILGGLFRKRTIISEGGIGGPVVKTGMDKFNAQVTFSDLITDTHPSFSTHNIHYEMAIEASAEEFPFTVTAPTQARSGIIGLWRIPDTFDRFSVRDKGGDEWASAGTLEWMSQHQSKLTKINDITGEHGRHTDLGHVTHARGTDIDIYHFGDVLAPPAPGNPVSGTANYEAARDLAVAAINGNGTAKATLKTWVEAQRFGVFDLLHQTVSRIICPLGGPDDTAILPVGWFRMLFEDGRFEATDGLTEVDIGGGFENGKVKFNLKNNNHYHIDLNDVALTQWP